MSVRSCREFCQSIYFSFKLSVRLESQSPACAVISLSNSCMVIGARKPRGLKRLLTTESTPLCVYGLYILGTWNVKMSDVIVHLTPRLCWSGRSSTNRLRFWRSLAWSSSGNTSTTSAFFEATLSLIFEAAKIFSVSGFLHSQDWLWGIVHV